MLNKIIILALIVTGSSMAQDKLTKAGYVQDNNVPLENRAFGTNGEGFDDISNLPNWIMDNQSNPVGTNGWFQGTTNVFTAQSGADDAYIAANFNSTAGTDICNYLILPDLGFLQSLSFWTRTSLNSNFPDRLLLLHSPTGGINTGDCFNSFGDFTTTLIQINPNLDTGGYPENWTQYSRTIDATGRFALVYYVADGGTAGSNSNYIGIDTVEWVAGLPSADLQLTINNNASGVLAHGDSVTFSHTLINNGPQDATNTSVIGSIPNGLEYVSNSCGATVSGSVFTWNIGNLANGNSAFCDVQFTVSGYGRIQYQATASADETDNSSANNTSASGVNGPIQIIPSLSLYGLLILFFGMFWFGLRHTRSNVKP